MVEPKRYFPGLNHSEFLGMKEHKRGDYVLYDDYVEAYRKGVKDGVQQEKDAVEYWSRH